ncbi:hypothetical protein F5Y16DRAFT_357674 [Xylariaceae sp. FL0255]|nr:hypothetical protein F5Y16DRAFT_357674 [Xylariaceae sp. FL0255]
MKNSRNGVLTMVLLPVFGLGQRDPEVKVAFLDGVLHSSLLLMSQCILQLPFRFMAKGSLPGSSTTHIHFLIVIVGRLRGSRPKVDTWRQFTSLRSRLALLCLCWKLLCP